MATKTKAECPSRLYLCQLAFQAGNVILGYGRKFEERTKADGSSVTSADITSNQFILEKLECDFPHVQVIAEEGSRLVERAECTVLCDPLDGTEAFRANSPTWTVCLSVLYQGRPIVAVIYNPSTSAMWEAEHGEGASLIGLQKLSVSSHQRIKKARISIVSWHNARFNLPTVYEKAKEMGVICISPLATAHFGGCVAEGSYDATISPCRNSWETAAMQLIVEEAGGKATDIFGNELCYQDLVGGMKGHIISNGKFHDELVELVRSCQ